jgi:arsenate reductase-like glutaredoxin family protein
MKVVRLTESELIDVIRQTITEGEFSKWEDEVGFEYKMVLAMIKTKYREIEELKQKASSIKKQMPELDIFEDGESYSMILKYFNPRENKVEKIKMNVGSKQTLRGLDEEEIREWAEQKAFNYLVREFPNLYYY